MTTETKSASIERFVASARRLILIQIIVGLLALGAAVIATLQILSAVERTERAEVRESAAKEADKVAQASTRRSQTFLALASMSRQILRASTPGEFAVAADALQEQASIVQDADVFSLLATAHYRAAGEPVPDCSPGALPSCDEASLAALKEARTKRLITAAAAAVEAIRANGQEVSDGGDGAPTHDVTSFLDLAAFQCAAIREQTAGISEPSADLFLAAVSAVSLPSEVSEQLSFSPATISEHNILQRECAGALEPIARDWLLGQHDRADSGISPADDAEAGMSPDPLGDVSEAATVQALGITNLYFHVPDEASRDLSNEIGIATARALASELRGTEVIRQHKAAYRPSIRYYYAEQADAAGRLREAIVREATALGVELKPDSLPVVQLRIANLPQDDIEVWLPKLVPAAELGHDAQEVAVSRIRSLEIRYYQRPADGLKVISALTPLVEPPAELRIENPQISGDAVNAVACNPDLSGEAFEEFKLMVLALMASGIEINHISGFKRPAPGAASKPANRVEIMRSSLETDHPLQPVDVRDLEACPRAGTMLRRN